MYFKTADIEGLRLFYREAGEPSKPTIVLLHGFPSSSYQFHDLIPLLADRFHVVAPDYPGMGFSEAPAPTVLRPTFDDVATVIDAFIAQSAPGPLILYLHDIGGPIGMRIAMAHPERIAGLIFQNFTTSVEGWNPERLKVYERLGGPETPEKLAETEQFATVERSSGRAIGSTRFMNIDRANRRVEIGSTWIAPPWQRTAVNTEAKYLMLRHAFEVWGCMRVELKTDALNQKSRNAILRIGAKEEGTLRRHLVTWTGRVRDTVYFSILDDEWPEAKRKLENKLVTQ